MICKIGGDVVPTGKSYFFLSALQAVPAGPGPEQKQHLYKK